MIRILIAEDHALVRRGTAVLLDTEPDMEVVGQACDGVEAVTMAEQLRPDVVLMDLHMPRQSGVAATREITRTLPGTQVLVLPHWTMTNPSSKRCAREPTVIC